MNKYVIITDGIVNIGGGQLYVNSKVEFLESKGWNTIVFSKEEGDVLIRGLCKFSRFIIRELSVYPMHLSKRKRNIVLHRMVADIAPSERVIIESHSTTLSIWGELLASICNGKHFIHNINEHPNCEPQLYPFFKFKYDRKEFATIKEKVLVNFFKPYFRVDDAKERVLPAVYTAKQVDDVEFRGIDGLDKKGKTIGVVGRLDKPFVLQVIRDLKEYANRNANTQYNIVIIGGDQSGRNVKGEIREVVSEVKNIALYMMGYMFPMPQKLIRMFDVCISSSGAVLSVAREKILTIAIDGHDLKPIGVCGITTEHSLFRKDEPMRSLGDILDEVFSGRYNVDLLDDFIKRREPRKIDFLQSHLDYIKQSDMSQEYYTDFRPMSMPKKLIICILGVKWYTNIWKRFHK